MKVPKSFRLEKDLDENVKRLLKEPKIKSYNPVIVEELLDLSKEFLQTRKGFYQNWYNQAIKLTRGIRYSLKDVEGLSRKIRVENEKSRDLGMYLSALINKVITENDKITLTLEEKLNFIGTYQEKGTITVEGDANDHTGYGMKGGKITVKGDAEYYTGRWMQGGELTVKGNTNNYTGYGMKGGKITVKEDVDNHTGYGMKGGKITVKGNTNNYTGYGIEGGELIVEGDANDHTGSSMEGGKLIVRGKIASISDYFKKGTIIQDNKTVRKSRVCLVEVEVFNAKRATSGNIKTTRKLR